MCIGRLAVLGDSYLCWQRYQMPFTFSHPAIVLPLTCLPKKWCSLTALIIGSITPDFEYFIRMRVKSEFSHTLPGLFYFDLPLGMCLFVLFNAVVRNPLVANLPVAIRGRFLLFPSLDWRVQLRRRFGVICFSLVVGALSHLLWDSFTHAGGYYVQMIPALQKNVVVMGATFPVFKVLQHISSILGIITILTVVFFLPVCENIPGKISTSYWFNVFGGSAGVLIIWAWLNEGEISIGNIVVAAIAALLFAIVLVPLIFSMNNESSV
jgi:membrane-bound metal-dependent hydrolase YbcI (DUF457 family)